MPFDSLLSAVRRTLRSVGRRPRSSAVIALCLTLGIGATTTAFTVIHPVLLEPLPYPEADRLAAISTYNLDRTDPEARAWVPGLVVDRLREESRTLQGVAAFEHRDFDLLLDDGPVRVPGARVLPGSFEVLGVQPVRGQLFAPGDGLRPVALISEGLWRRRFGGDEEVLERTLRIGGQTFHVIGVLSERQAFPGRAELWTPLHHSHQTPEEWIRFGILDVVARLAPGASSGDLAGELAREAEHLKAVHPLYYAGKGLEHQPLDRSLRGDYRRPLFALLAAAAFVLAIAVANAINLLAVRLQEDHRSRATKIALGASRGRLARHLFAEILVLCAVGGGLGLAFAGALARVLPAVAPVDDPLFDRVALTPQVALVTILLVVAVAGVLTLLATTRSELRILDALRAGRVGVGRRERRLQRGFVLLQVAVALTLLTCGALMAKSFANLSRVDLGFDPTGQLTARVSAPPTRSGTQQQRVRFFEEILEEVRAMPGVTAAGATHRVLLADGDWSFGFSVEERVPDDLSTKEQAVGRVVTAGFFEAAGIPVLRGRAFTDRDRADGRGVVVVSRALEAQYWPGESAVGKRLKRGAYDNPDFPWLEVVGVVEDVRSSGPAAGVKPALYYPLAQIDGAYLDTLGLTVRTVRDPASLVPELRSAIARIAPTATVFRPLTGTDAVFGAVASERFQKFLLALFAAVGVSLAAAGLYTITSDSVARRSRELAMRMALGAGRDTVLGRIFGEAALLAACGIAAGLGASLLAAYLLGDLLYQVSPFAPGVHLPVAAALAVVTMVASWMPAWRATRVDPAAVLREE